MELDVLHGEVPLADAVDAARAHYIDRNPESRRRLETARQFMPGGNTRSVLYYGPFPIVLARGEGCRLWDVDQHEYVDALGEFTAGLVGHNHPVIRAALIETFDNGINLGGHNTLEPELARIICERFASIDRVRFTNSGTEANLMAIVLAQVFTDRKKIVVFSGGYHGSILGFTEVSPATAPHDFIILPYNDTARVVETLAAQGKDVAAVLVEPMLGAGGCIPADPEFLATIRAETEKVGALMILDEVMTSRMSGGGRQQLLGLTPDLTTLGKYIGGGMSFGAFGGRQEIMALFDPGAPKALQHAGTFNNNVLTMAAGIASMSEIFTAERADAFYALGEAFRDRLNAICRAHDVAMQFTGLGSVMNVQFRSAPIRTFEDATDQDTKLKELYFLDMIEAGIYIARRGLTTLMLPMADTDLDRIAAAVETFVVRRKAYLG
ncbi:MAG: aspartate aminotransferase family protein [Sphingomonas sp.]|uniref:aspartate aminotransferase family protein n=1 Tax=Sphingomonas sp. TaxID=28214 RepID=UPI00356146FB